jgi:hypothetical protein
VDRPNPNLYPGTMPDGAPEFDPGRYGSPEYRDKIGGYYGGTYDTLPSPAGYGGTLAPPLNSDAAGAMSPQEMRDRNS